MSWEVSVEGDSYEEAVKNFSWDGIPDDYNIARDCVEKHEAPGRTTALYQERKDGSYVEYSFAEIEDLSDRLAQALSDFGIVRGDRVAIANGQQYETLAAHLACWKLAAITVPLSVLFGTESLRHRLVHSGAKIALFDRSLEETLNEVRSKCVDLQRVIWIEENDSNNPDTFKGVISGETKGFDPVNTDIHTPAIILYTSGTTGTPKGVLHTHGVWLGHCPAFYMYFERKVHDSIFWTPADWAWIGALGSLVFPAWHYGQPVVGTPREAFDPNKAFQTMEQFDVTDAFIPPTALRMTMQNAVSPGQFDLSLETIVSGSEALSPEIIDWMERSFEDVTVNEAYGQTEASVVSANCRDWFDQQRGSMGKPVVGFDVKVINAATGETRSRGELGEIAVRRTAPVGLFEEYWRAPQQTAAVRRDGWHLTGDLAVQDEDDFLWFRGRTDDLIITSGYRIAPNEIELALLKHSAVADVGVVGVPDETRGEVIKAVVKPREDVNANSSLRRDLKRLVREEVAEYAYPREITFVSDLSRMDRGKLDRDALRDQ